MIHRASLICVGFAVGFGLSAESRAQELSPSEEKSEHTSAASEEVVAADGEEPTPEGTLSPEIESCVSSHEEAQVARLEERLGAAESALEDCALESCPQVIREDCRTWSREVAAAFPTLVVRARGISGDIAEAKVFVDGVQTSALLDGVPLRVEPGRHSIRVELPSGESAEQSLVFSTGEPARFLEFDLRPSEAPLEKAEPIVELEATRPVSWLSIGLGATALGATALAVGFGIDATAQNNQALDTCAPHCSTETSERVNRSAAIADVSWAVAIVSAVGAAVSYSMRPTVYQPAEVQTASSSAGPLAGGSLAVRSLKKGASLCWQGSF